MLTNCIWEKLNNPQIKYSAATEVVPVTAMEKKLLSTDRVGIMWEKPKGWNMENGKSKGIKLEALDSDPGFATIGRSC